VKWPTAWQIIKDVLLTGTGLVIIIFQIWSPHPSDVLLVVGLALTVPSAAGHAASILAGPGAHPSSGSSDAHGERGFPPSSSEPG
jgi:hypothetical protein